MARKSPLLPGWSRVPGKAKRYLTPQGENVSYRQYLNVKANEAGFLSFAQRTDIRNSAIFKVWAETMARKKGISYEQVTRDDGSFVKHFVAAYVDADGKILKTTELDHAAFEPLALLLEHIGIREEGATYPVGGSPE